MEKNNRTLLLAVLILLLALVAFNFGGISGKVSDSGGNWLQFTLQGSCGPRDTSVIGRVTGNLDNFRTKFKVESDTGRVITTGNFGQSSLTDGRVSGDVVIPCGINNYVRVVAEGRSGDPTVESNKLFVD